MSLIDSLINEGWLKTPRIIEAFRKIKRADFLPEDIKNLAELNEALPIGFGQTISQPLVVAFMIEELKPESGDKILDVGSGSGWTSALLAYIVSQKGNPKFEIRNHKQIQNSKLKIPNGKVIAVEVIPELKEFGEKNVAKYNFIKKGIVEFICADGSKGYEKEAPFDKILVSAAAREFYPAWKEQLKIGGRIVVPIGSSIWVIHKKSEREFIEREYPGFAFVPLITK
ncbi:MAG: protein-L-isoaspartate O-methyltransferase [Patescibacteria group bacterium]|nr:protein-L-isoaspartate O-methyltransferase [Patescibacteria group bacterium]